MNYYRKVFDHFQLNCVLYSEVVKLEEHNGHFNVHTHGGKVFHSRFVAVATGYFDNPSPLGVQGEALPHVSHYYNDPLPFHRRRVVVVGGKNSAVEAALDLWRHGADVTVVHRGEKLSHGVKYWILPDFENRVAQGSITMHLKSTVKEFLPHSTIIQKHDGTIQEIPTDSVFILIGYRPDTDLLCSFGIEVDPETLGPRCNPETMESNIRGMFVAGGMVGGRFNNKVFIENGREHGKTIVQAILKNSRAST